MPKRKAAGKAAGKAAVRVARRKVGHCENQWCGEVDVLTSVAVQFDGKVRAKPRRLCRACTFIIGERLAVHDRSWPTRYP